MVFERLLSCRGSRTFQLHLSWCSSVRRHQRTSSSSPFSNHSARASNILSAASGKYTLTDAERVFYQEGILNEEGLTVFSTLYELVDRSCRVYATKKLFGTYSQNDQAYHWITYADFAATVDLCRALLKDLGVKEDTKVGIISKNRCEWASLAAATYSLKATWVPMYEEQLPQDWSYIVKDSGARVLFCSTDDIYHQVRKNVMPYLQSSSQSPLQEVLSLDGAWGEPHAFATAIASVQADCCKALVSEPLPEDLANLLYTSGTTGKPKGVELTHSNIASNVLIAARTMVHDPRSYVRDDDRTLAFLPWAHSYGHTCELWMALAHGFSVGISRGIPFIKEELKLVQPSAICGVPKLYQVVYDEVSKVMQKASPGKRIVMQRALNLGRRKADSEQGIGPALGWIERLRFRLLDFLVLRRIRQHLGGKVRHAFAGGSACPVKVIEFFESIGIPIHEGYGLTETSPIISANTPECRKVGTVGKPILGVAVYILDELGNQVPVGQEGEICCVGHNVMRAYHRDPEATANVMTVAPHGEPNMFHTGDLGHLDAEGFLTITGRIKDQYKLSNGKYVAPTPIEDALLSSPWIEQVLVTGESRPFNVALIVPDWKVIRAELSTDETMLSNDDICKDAHFNAMLETEIQSSCQHLKKFEIPQRWAVVMPFTPENRLLTPKFSVRRRQAVERYADLIASLYKRHNES